MTSTKKGRPTSSCILSEVTILRNKRSENVLLKNESHMYMNPIYKCFFLYVYFIAMIKTRVCHIVVVLLTYSCHSYLHTAS